LPLVPAAIRQAMQDRQYAQAVQELDKLLAAPKQANPDYLHYLKGRAYFLNGQTREAADTFAALEKDWPNSSWVRRARLDRAQALLKLRDVEGAEKLYEQAVRELLAPERRQELAALYLEFADLYFQPAAKETAPNYAKALEFYRQALPVGVAQKRQAEVEFRVARCLQEMKNLGDAEEGYKAFAKKHATHALAIEARFQLGRVQLEASRPADARRTWQDLLAAHPRDPQKPLPADAQDRLAEAAFHLAHTYGLPQPANMEALELGVAAARRFLKEFPEHKLAPQAAVEIGESYAHLGRLDASIAALKELLASPKQAPPEILAQARILLGRDYSFQKKFAEATTVWQEFLTKHPAHPAWAEVQRWLINLEFQAAADAYRAKNYAEARKLWEAFLVKYPLASEAPFIMLQFGQMRAKAEQFPEAVAEWKQLVNKYPNTEEASQAQFLLGLTLEQKLHDFPGALEAYKKLTWGNFAGPAAQRLQQLTRQELNVVTERVFRTSQPARVKVTLRNIHKLTIKAYQIDLETYFRKMHLAQGLEKLDVALIDPDASWTYEVQDYQDYKQLVREIEVPQTGPGVLAVSVVHEPKTDEKVREGLTVRALEATTMVLRSDLDLLVKCSRNELFVFAQNLRTGRPFAGAKLLISDGQTVFAEAKTGPDGVFIGRATEADPRFEPLKTARDLRVFALSDADALPLGNKAGAAPQPDGPAAQGAKAGQLPEKAGPQPLPQTTSSVHTASNVVGLRGLNFAQGLSPAGYLFADRPAFRPGQVVNIRGIVRWVQGDEYVYQAGGKWKLDWYDSQNRKLHGIETTLSEFGTVAARFLLPDSAPVGDYRVHLYDPDQPETRTFQGSFTVYNYQLEPLELAVETPQQVYYRGQEVTGTIKLRYYYGLPLAKREVVYILPDGTTHTAQTDDAGEVAFKFDTREFQEDQTLQIQVRYPERSLERTTQVFLAVRGFQASVSTIRDTYLTGETFDAEVQTRDPAGKPLGQNMTLTVLRQEIVQGELRETQLQELPVKTDPKTGLGRLTLKLEQSGSYLVRAQGTDQFGNPVSAQSDVQISGEEDLVRLRVLAEKHQFQVGETALVNIHWRDAPALALVAYQGAQVLDYKLVELKTGLNPWQIPLTEKLAPNFELLVSVMTDTGGERRTAAAYAALQPGKLPDAAKDLLPLPDYHEAQSFFEVQQALQIRVQAGKSKFVPGEEVTVTVQTTDPQGKGLPAEVSLALIERNLLDRFPDSLGELSAYFGKARRESALRSVASCRFRYTPRTKEINQFLLAEARREDQAAKEKQQIRALARQQEAVSEMARLDDQKREMVDQLEQEEVLRDQLDSSVAGLGQDRDEDLGRLLGENLIVNGHDLPQATNYYFEGERGNVEELLAFGVPQGQPAQLGANSAAAGFANGQVAGGSNFGGLGFAGGVGGGGLGGGGGFVPGNQEWQMGLQLGAVKESERGNLGLVISQTPQVPPRLPEVRAAALEDLRSLALSADGAQRTFFDTFGRAARESNGPAAAQSEFLAEGADRFVAQLLFGETGYWNPSITTDASGKAEIKFRVPDRASAWKLLARGVTKGALAGQTELDWTTARPLFAELKLPASFVEGDRSEITAIIHNDALAQGQIDLTLTTVIGGKTLVDRQQVKVSAKGLQEVSFTRTLLGTGPATFTLTLAAGELKAEARRTAQVRPHGVPVYSTVAGTAEAAATVWIRTPEKMPVREPKLKLLVGPSWERSLLEAVLDSGFEGRLFHDTLLACYSPQERTNSDLLAALGLLRSLQNAGDNVSEERVQLGERIRAAIGALTTSQRDDGGWAWSGRGAKSDLETTARTLWALALAQRDGFAVPEAGYQKAVQYVKQAFTQIQETDYLNKGQALQALTVAGHGDFAYANRLYRARAALRPEALAYVALIFAEMERPEIAVELLNQLSGQLGNAPAVPGKAPAGLQLGQVFLPDAEVRALALLAWQRAQPNSPQVKLLADWLQAHRSGARWQPEQATGPAILGLSQQLTRGQFPEQKYQLQVIVNNQDVATLELDPRTGSRIVDVPNEVLQRGEAIPGEPDQKRHQIRFELIGRGKFTFQGVLSGFVAADQVQRTMPNWNVTRVYQPAPWELDGREVPRGFDVLTGNYNAWLNPVTQLPVGKRANVRLSYYRYLTNEVPTESLDYLVLTEPLPCGTQIVEGSITGDFERYELAPGQITFYLGRVRGSGSIQFDLYGTSAGEYRLGPTILRGYRDPAQMVTTAPRLLTVLPAGEKSSDEYKLTPRELYELGTRYLAKGDQTRAGLYLSELFDKYQLRPEIYRETAQKLLEVSLQQGQPGPIVRYFEVLKEKYPDLELSFTQIFQVGAAYRDLREYERAYLVFRATAEASFLRETQVAGFLDGQGEYRRAADVLDRLLREYPSEPYVAAATYTLAQGLASKAPQAATDENMQRLGLTRVGLLREGLVRLDDFLTVWPNDPAADEASFSLASLLVDLEQWDSARERCQKFATRFPQSSYLDSFWYVSAYCQFALGQHPEALALCKQVAEATRRDPASGREVESKNRWRAIFIAGQIHHALNQAAEAVAEYQKVADRFSDAKEAIVYFTRQEISLPEVTIVKPAQPVEPELAFRNVARCEVKVYRIDLLKFSLLERDLSGITKINLAGIRPLHETVLELGDGKDFRERTKKLSLPLQQEGAYLVMCRGENLYASGLVLITPLSIEAQEDVASGRVRATVKDQVTGKNASAVQVKVIGSHNDQFRDGQTDFRGVFVADQIRGKSTIIARAGDDRYAFYRGERELGPPVPTEAAPAPADPNMPTGEVQLQQQLLEEVQGQNSIIQQHNYDRLQNLYRNENRGVRVQSTQ